MKTVQLSKQYVVGSAIFESLTFRAPKAGEYRRIGKVADMQQGVYITFQDAIWKYADKLVLTVPAGALDELDLGDGMRVEHAIMSFFSEAVASLPGSTASSSNSDGAPNTSTG